MNADPGKKALNPVQADMEATLPTGLYDPAQIIVFNYTDKRYIRK